MKEIFKSREEIGFVLANILLATFCFFLGTIFAKRENLTLKEPEISFEKEEIEVKEKTILSASKEDQKESLFVASKKGKVYHFPWCPGAKAIKEENKIYFSSKEEAEKAGYYPAKNCPGL